MTRDEFKSRLCDCVEMAMDLAMMPPYGPAAGGASEKLDVASQALLDAFNEMHEKVEALKVGVPLTLENADRVRVVEVPAGSLHGGFPVDGFYAWHSGAGLWSRHTGMPWYATTEQVVGMGATVLAWRT